jgi:phosphatidate cytidylyltransferase
MASSQSAKRFDWNNLGIRVLSGAILAPLALTAVWFGGPAFLVLMAVGVALLTIEWGAMCDSETPVRAAVVIAVAILASIFFAYRGHPWIGWMVVAIGAGAGAVFTLLRGRIDRPADIAFGVLYVGAPAVALVWLRGAPGGREWTLMLLAVVWSADICAFLVGNALKGPKLWRRSGRCGRGRHSVLVRGPKPGGGRLDRAACGAGGHGGRPLGVDVEATFRGQGLRRSDSRTWRTA